MVTKEDEICSRTRGVQFDWVSLSICTHPNGLQPGGEETRPRLRNKHTLNNSTAVEKKGWRMAKKQTQ